jgi:hypothetical protein
MSERAEVTSIDAIAEFRAALLIYISKVRPLLDDSADEVSRTREWLRVTQRVYWENQVRIRTRELTDAQQALFSADLAKLRPATNAEVNAVQKARRALAAAEEKLRILKHAAAGFEKEALPKVKQVESLRSVVASDLLEGIHYLERIIGALDRYVHTPRVVSGTSHASISPGAAEPAANEDSKGEAK